MGIIISMTAAAFVAIYFLNLGNQVTKMTPRIDPDGPPAFSHLIYGDFDKGALDKPMDIAKIGEFIYVSDTKNKRIQVFDAGGTPIFQFGKEGDGPGEFMFPYGITGDKKGRVFVADLFNGNISIFDSKGKFIDYFNDKNKILKAPGGLRIVDEQLYVTDIEKGQVFKFDLEGKLLMALGQPGEAEGQFRAPNAVTVDDEGKIYVVDTGNQRVQIFDKEGKFKKIINGSDDGKGKATLVNPRGIDVDSRGFIYVVNNLTHFIYAFDQEGKKAFQFGGIGDQNEQFYLPNGLFIDDSDYVYITDTLNQRIAVYY
jgi:DNA-binding beta-propeller fold protein YncE